jgi:hypothetical protein
VDTTIRLLISREELSLRFFENREVVAEEYITVYEPSNNGRLVGNKLHTPRSILS